MRCSAGMVLPVAALLLAFSTGAALEKVSARAPDDLLDEWSAGATTQRLAYYNLCGGWVWIWTVQPGERVGVHYRTNKFPDVEPTLLQSHINFANGAPAGYGFTGTVSVHVADSHGCPTGPALASQPLLPQPFWNVHDWTTTVPWLLPGWVLLFTNTSTPGLPIRLHSDRPAGPPGPEDACGVCYPATRTVHSFRYGTAASPICPGERFVDGTGCAAELVWAADGWFWEWTNAAVGVTGSMESRSWGKVKALYR